MRLLVMTLSSLVAFACSAPGPNLDAGATVVTCPTPTGGPTTHNSSITTSQTWTADGSPHVVSGAVYVKSGATLTIEPCAEIQLAKEAVLGSRDGTFLAEGTASMPIRFHGKDGAAWTKLEFNAPGLARLAFVEIEGGGGAGVNDTDDTSVEVRGDGNMPADPVLFVDHVTVRNSKGAGLAIFSLATFVAGSRDLTITGSGGTRFAYPLSLEEHSIDSLPSGAYTGNVKDELYLRLAGAGRAGDGLKVDATLHERGVPYRLAGGFNVAVNEDGKLSTLTIEPGVTIKVPAAKAFKIETWTGNKPSSGALRALGTAEKPIRFTSASDTPAPGDWMGLWFGNVPGATNRLDHVIIEYAGADCGCSLATCAMLPDFDGAVLLTNRPAGGAAFITNTTFRHVKGHAIVEGWFENEAGGGLIDFLPTNNFEDVSGCTQTRPGNSVAGGCPSPRPACF